MSDVVALSSLTTNASTGSGDILQIECAKLLERQIEPIHALVTHRSRDTDATRRTFGLKPCRHIHRVTVEVSPIGDRSPMLIPTRKRMARSGG